MLTALDYACSKCGAPPSRECPETQNGYHPERRLPRKLDFLGIYISKGRYLTETEALKLKKKLREEKTLGRDTLVLALCDNFVLAYNGIIRVKPGHLIPFKRITVKELRQRWGQSKEEFDAIVNPLIKDLTSMPHREAISDRSADKKRYSFDWETWRKERWSLPRYRREIPADRNTLIENNSIYSWEENFG